MRTFNMLEVVGSIDNIAVWRQVSISDKAAAIGLVVNLIEAAMRVNIHITICVQIFASENSFFGFQCLSQYVTDSLTIWRPGAGPLCGCAHAGLL